MISRILDLPIEVEHAAFAGHFPGRPILPGVVLLDAALQQLALQGCIDPDDCSVPSFKFWSPVRPGERLTLRFDALANGSISVRISAGERVVAGGIVTPLTGACER